ncbi:MAG TPA: glycosyltransferase [Verrucomicrobiae bacterium]|nr:glycosyltransferase [Verrucomicrobiae bacterium]
MRIVLCTESYPPAISGVSVFTSKAAMELQARGHDVIVIAPSQNGSPKRENKDGVPVYRLRSIPSPFRQKYRHVVGQQLAISRILKRFEPDIIHIQDPGGCSSAALRWGRRHDVPVVGTRHFATNLVAAYFPFAKMLPEEAVHGIIDMYSREFFKLCTVVTCPTDTVRQYMLGKGFEIPMVVISNGVDLPKLDEMPKPRKGIPTILTVSRIDEDKNIELLLKSAPLVKAKRDVEFVIVGGGNKLQQYRQYVKDQKLSSYVRFTGAVKADSPALTSWYTRSTLFAIPSLVETQSLVTLEAMSYALPVVAVRAGALPELIKPNQTGYLVPVPTPAHFSKSLLAALDYPDRTREFGVNGRRLVEREHARPHCIDQLVQLYEATVRGDYSPKTS